MPSRNLKTETQTAGSCAVPTHYNAALTALHWLIAVLVISQIPLGFLQIGTTGALYHNINIWHVNIGFTILLLMILRLIIRLSTRGPGKVPGTPWYFHRTAQAVHGLLYALLIVEPFIGLMVTDEQGYPLRYLGFIPIWDPIGKAPWSQILAIHGSIALAIVALIVLHILGALYHRVIRRDGTLARMT